ncbi:hypothetical protein [Salmonella enterica]|uniref:Uncharacterized protein n=1 Tax=Salmonella enterica subsp. diarizonae serovar 60:r:e,n,x,z15 TaxID=1173779 RepID=A0A8E9YAV8_SALDZ|nr:hypothetical protein [Salmonella enterica]OHF67738.1 hypothetical protein A7S96_05985 [Salmonella enterica subsp. diarizonae serovar 60:r:e,n,x,z15]OHF72148.1 hypothetical protein A7T04_02605 [Salmonella enterica subsp. diarizonae serovar 60:r:e,n,x,z15]OHF76617.1 hypothetical protein A7T09_02605 [Salmonella enterica subsp. diarizonae serovar 60:r:e,n,x,z15]OHF80745.1 hypothetical protein A7T26_00540 [Salmonella enterica subsp. diarizonae serovar 60:r:e,n,x,z15]OHF90267.1 hypothetical prote
MKLTIEDVQVAIKGVTKYSNQCISDQLLAVVAGNYATANHIILLRLQSLYEDEYSDFTVGEIKNLYYTEKTGKAQLRGDLIFGTEKLDIQSILHSLAHGCVYLSPHFMNVASLNYGFARLSQVTLSKAEDTDFDGIEPLDISCLDGLINALYKEEPATEAPAEPQEGNSPYIHAPGMSREDVLAWIKDVYNNALSANREEKELRELKANSHTVESLLADREKLLTAAIRN